MFLKIHYIHSTYSICAWFSKCFIFLRPSVKANLSLEGASFDPKLPHASFQQNPKCWKTKICRFARINYRRWMFASYRKYKLNFQIYDLVTITLLWVKLNKMLIMTITFDTFTILGKEGCDSEKILTS